MDITVHHLEYSRSHRILWFLEEAGLPYTLKTYPRDPKTMRIGSQLKGLHPRGRAPVVEVDGVVLAESGAILEELSERAGALRPNGVEDCRRCRYFMHYAEGSLMPPLLLALVVGKLRGDAVPWPVRLVTGKVADLIDDAFTNGEIREHLAFMESELEGRQFLVGENLSIADVQMSFAVEALLTRSRGNAPRTQAYLAGLQQREAYKRALEKGGPVML